MAAGRDMRIIITGYNRPGYMRETIASWAKARGIERVMTEFHLEPGHPEVETACVSAPFPHQTFIAGQRQGVQRNPWKAASHAFGFSDFVILAEDDMIVGTDTLEYFRWAEGEYRDNPGVLAISAAHRGPACAPPTPAACSLRRQGEFWVWGTWRDRWDLIGPDWTFDYEHNGWDYRLDGHWCRERGMMMLTPNLSRVQHIGREGGTHCLPGMFEGLLSPCFLPEAGPQAYYTV
jgi:hypothetical protein